jgi:phosphoglycerate dehydrogenase-like enzyme
MEKYLTLFLTHRGQFHQQNILAAAPEELEITMLRDASKEEILRLLPAMDFLMTEREDVIDADLIAAGRKLRLIQRLGSQTWDIDLAAAKKSSIPVCYWPDQSVINVAEHALMMTLNLVKKMRELSATIDAVGWTGSPRLSDEDTFAYNWTGRKGIGTLRHKQVGILGLGEVGRELAARLKGFDCQVLYHKRRRMPLAAEKEIGITYLPWEDLTGRSDVIYGLLPYSNVASQSFDASFFARMKPGSYFVFCGGSGLVDEQDLLDALHSGHLAGAALDTYTYEPLPVDSPLLTLHRDPSVNLILTPHVAAGTLTAGRSEDYSNLLRRLGGRDLLYRVA